MEYIGIGICIAAMFTICAIVILKARKKNNVEEVIMPDTKHEDSGEECRVIEPEQEELIIQMDMIPAESIEDESLLVEITDRKVLTHINSLIPGLIQAGNAVNNAVHAASAANGEVLYRAIIPAGAKLTDSKAMEGAFRGIYHGDGGIKGHANLVAAEAQKGASAAANAAAAAMGVASMVVGQYYMAQIDAELGVISDGISQIQNFQDNEYRSRVFSLVTHVKKLTDFQTEILENDELRITKIVQLDSLEEECTQLLGQANSTLNDFTKKTDFVYEEYEKVLENAQSWFMYQKSLLDVMHRIADLRYTLHLGAVSREHCGTLLLTYTEQVRDTQERLTSWHQGTTERLGIDVAKIRRKRTGFEGAVFYLPGLINKKYNFRSIEKKTAVMIAAQESGHEQLHYRDTSELYNENVQLIARDGKIYYLPEIKAE